MQDKGWVRAEGQILKRGQMGKKRASPLLRSLQPCSTASALGTESLGSIKGPSVFKEGTETGSRSGEPGISPRRSQMRRVAKRKGSDMPAAGVTRPGKHRFHFRWWNGSVLRHSPSGQQRGKGWSLGCRFVLRGSEREPDLTQRVQGGSGDRREDPEPPALRPGLPEHSPIQVPIARFRSQPPVCVVGHPPLLAAAVRLSPGGKAPARVRRGCSLGTALPPTITPLET